jgi:parvulin-like peptidyl-prolyl isomerase
LAKKEKKATSERVPTKHQLSKWQRQMKTRRIVIVAAAVFLVGISSWIGYGFYKDYKSDPLRQVVIKVNDVQFNMEDFVDVLDLVYMNLTGGNSTELYYYADYFTGTAADQIISAELVTQGAKNLNIAVTSEEIDAALQQYGLPDGKVYRDLIGASLLDQKIRDHFDPGENATMEQADTQVMLLESQEVANEVMARIEAGGNFTALAEEFACNSSVARDLGWLPEELMPNTAIANAAFNLTAGQTSQPIYDATVTKNVGYWLIEVTAAQNETIDAQVMLLGSEAQAEQIKAELAAGGNFTALAGNYSQDESKTNGGMLAGLQPGDMGSAAFDQVAFNMPLNHVSDPVKDESMQTTGGYWIVKVIDRGDHQLDETVRQQLIDKRYNDWFEAWRNSSTIENLLDSDKNAWAIDEVFKRESQ